RIMHWVNALCVVVVLMSGLQIFNAHPRLYWGQYGANFDKALITLEPARPGEHAFPGWATVPGWYDLAAGRRWHFLFAWVLVVNSAAYLAISLARGHVRRDLLPKRGELVLHHLWSDIRDHARLRFARGEAAERYNTLQKLTYLAVIFILGPLMLGTGLTMSPGIDAACPWLVDLFGGRQSA